MSLQLNQKVKSEQAGFTLVELIVALAIGLIVSAAALQLFTGGLITAKLQEASAELQDSGVFGVEYVARDIRLANFGNTNNPILNGATQQGGIVFTSGETGNVNLKLKGVDANLLTKSGGTADTNLKSDQLTIQFRAPNKMVNCEGKEVKTGEYVIQRYFLSGSTGGLALTCDANNTGSNDVSIAGLSATDKGVVIMPRVDLLRFYIGAKVGNNFSYYTIDQFNTSTNSPRAISIRMMVLVRSKDPITSKNIDPSKETFGFPDGTVKPTDTKTQYLRRLYTTNIALRNGLGEKVYESSN